jgi:hypothetical protein
MRRRREVRHGRHFSIFFLIVLHLVFCVVHYFILFYFHLLQWTKVEPDTIVTNFLFWFRFIAWLVRPPLTGRTDGWQTGLVLTGLTYSTNYYRYILRTTYRTWCRPLLLPTGRIFRTSNGAGYSDILQALLVAGDHAVNFQIRNVKHFVACKTVAECAGQDIWPTQHTHSKIPRSRETSKIPRSRETSIHAYLACKTPSGPCNDIMMIYKCNNGEETSNGKEEKATGSNWTFERW